MKNLYVIRYLLLAFLWFFSAKYILSQKKVNIIAGIGLPELIHAGVRYQMGQTQLGGSFGYGGDSTYSINGDFLYHFGKVSDLSKRKRWYGKLGVGYNRSKSAYDIFKSLVLTTRIGKEYNISHVLGIGVDAGLTFLVYEENTEIKPKPGWNINFDFGILEYVLPTAAVHLFYKL